MDFFTRNTPVYKRANVMQGAVVHAQRTATSGLSDLLGSLFSSATPAYKTADGRGVNVPAKSSGLLSMFAVTPSYKTATAETVAEPQAGDPVLDEGACAPGPDEIVVL